MTTAEVERGSLERIAYHEAGHAVAAIDNGCGVTSATILEDDDSYGKVSHGMPPGWPPDLYAPVAEWREVVDKVVLMCLAGSAAEVSFLGGEKGIEPSRSDYETACECANLLYGRDELQGYLEAMGERIYEWVEKKDVRCRILAVATALLRHGRLSGPDVRDLCAQADAN